MANYAYISLTRSIKILKKPERIKPFEDLLKKCVMLTLGSKWEVRQLSKDGMGPVENKAVEHAKKQSHSELLKQVVTTDQSARKEYSAHMQKHGGDWKAARKSWIAQKKTSPGDIFGDRAGHKQIKKAEPHFDHSKFSGKDWHHYWLHAQHSDQDPAYQRHALGVIKKHLGSEHSHYKYLHDRISCSTKGKQRYGTQDICEK